jgi:hypothetical protein
MGAKVTTTSRRPEVVAALTNGFVVIATAYLLIFVTGGAPTNDMVHARAITPFEQAVGSAARASLPALFVAPLAAVVVWRTRTHAMRYMPGESRGWSGVLEGGVVGALIPAALLLPAVLVRVSSFVPSDFGMSEVVVTLLRSIAAGFGIGAACALVLRQVAIVVLRIVRP